MYFELGDSLVLPCMVVGKKIIDERITNEDVVGRGRWGRVQSAGCAIPSWFSAPNRGQSGKKNSQLSVSMRPLGRKAAWKIVEISSTRLESGNKTGNYTFFFPDGH